MIFITGDCHGNFEKFNTSIFPEQTDMTKDDYVIICGDFGGGILEMDDPNLEAKRKKLDKGWEPYRINHLSWWEQEMPTEEEMEEGRRNLAAHGNKVDFIISHCCASSTLVCLSAGTYEPDILTKYFNEIQRSGNIRIGFLDIIMITATWLAERY